ncbi:hypothetical protein Pla144_14510 [Bythopirellula polymerisocia]|uniref:Uncharacterized protein n=2 Tax=Bythopirellula polymerisocia TaxID=2528003 RepID=A0A5C6CWQ8_9BACT|nr:hypothetical protein Pla144_14510 [Bythopirellula polymerisocia]
MGANPTVVGTKLDAVGANPTVVGAKPTVVGATVVTATGAEKPQRRIRQLSSILPGYQPLAGVKVTVVGCTTGEKATTGVGQVLH